MLTEIDLEKGYLGGEELKTIYFGGGTPSLLSFEECQLLITKIKEVHLVSPGAEITIECNPDDITSEKLQEWKTIGINRLSIGLQSFKEDELKWMNRAHTADQAINSLKLATTHFSNITIDLIYGSPLLTDENWKQNVQTALLFNIPHLSCYALTVEEKTPLHKQINTKKTPDVDNEKQARQFLLLMQWLRDAGYEHYEVSNFAKPGFRSKHNSSYWKGDKYLGIGPSAHSYNGSERRWNIANNTLYINAIKEGKTERETELLTNTEKINELIMISLRTIEGLDLQHLESFFGTDKRLNLEKEIYKFINAGYVRKKGSLLQLTDEGMLRADGIASELFFA